MGVNFRSIDQLIGDCDIEIAAPTQRPSLGPRHRSRPQGLEATPCPKLLRIKKTTEIFTLNCRILKTPIQQHLLAKLLSDPDTYCLPPRMSTKGPTNHKPVSYVRSRESSLYKASRTKFCSLYHLSPRMLTYFKNTVRIAYYCLAVITLPFGINSTQW